MGGLAAFGGSAREIEGARDGLVDRQLPPSPPFAFTRRTMGHCAAVVVTDASLVGRRTELETIASALYRARDGRSSVVVVRGVAGVGKTALLDQSL